MTPSNFAAREPRVSGFESNFDAGRGRLDREFLKRANRILSTAQQLEPGSLQVATLRDLIYAGLEWTS
jgi:hypothetical protein